MSEKIVVDLALALGQLQSNPELGRAISEAIGVPAIVQQISEAREVIIDGVVVKSNGVLAANDNEPAVYLHDWEDRGEEGLLEDFRIEKVALVGAKVLVASYTYEDYSGDAYVLFERGGKLFEVHGSHCSCYGLEDQWDPEEVDEAAIRHRLTEGTWGEEGKTKEATLAALDRRKLVAANDNTPNHAANVNALVALLHGKSTDNKWWIDPVSGEDLSTFHWFPYVVGTKLMLMVSEISEGMEGHLKGLMDDKLPHRPMIEVELADAVIRICDLAGKLRLDLGGAIIEKTAFNDVRPDHKMEARQAAGGKAY